MNHTLKFRTNLNCNACVAAVKPFLDNEPSISSWDVDIASSGKTLTVHGEAVSRDKVRDAVAKAGFKILDELGPASSEASKSMPNEQVAATTYFPLLLILAFLLGTSTLLEVKEGGFTWDRAMSNFMGGFFLVFSFFKLLDLRGFVDSYQMYDVVAKRFRAYGYAYPFIELLLGMAYLTGVQPRLTNLVTLVVMFVSAVGVIKSLMEKRKIRCVCLGTVFNLPMSTVTLVEDSLMAGMAALMLFIGAHDKNSFFPENHHAGTKDAYIMQTNSLDVHHGHHNRQIASSPISLFVIEDSINQAGDVSELQLRLKRFDGTTITEFATDHGEKVHLAIVRNGLDTFAHVHPQVQPDGTLVVPYAFPVGGTYRVYADFKVEGSVDSTASTIINVPGDSPAAPVLQVNAPGRVHGDDWLADIALENDVGGTESTIRFDLMDAGDQPIQNLKLYMGTRGHLQIVSADGSQYVHAHPVKHEPKNEMHVVRFHTTFPNRGIYKGWGQFQVGENIWVIPFVFESKGQS